MEVMVVIILMGVLGGVAAFSLRPLYQSYRFRMEVDAVYGLMQELQLEAMTLKSDVTLSFSEEKGKWLVKSKSDETILKPQKIDLSHVKQIDKALPITLYSSGMIEPSHVIKFSSGTQERWIDLSHKHLIKISDVKPILQQEPIPQINEVKMKLKSSAFKDHGTIPESYTCEGKNINPPLEFMDIPESAVSCVLIMDDPDVPTFLRKDQMWVHWVVFNIPPTTNQILENSTPSGILGKGTGGEVGYQGPCPPDREHRYFFKLYALDTMLKLSRGATKMEVEQAMKSHIIASAELVGVYNKKANRA
jgi:Raf kinase inhibitor-like YbhB/YbcL family protein